MDRHHFIFLPGFMCDGRLFLQQTKALTEHGHSCSIADLSGDETIEDMARRVLRSGPDTFVPVGLSMGGIVAFDIYRQAPERVNALALLNTTFHSDKAEQQRKTQLQRVSAGELDLVLRDELKPNYMHPENRTPDRLALLLEMARDLGEVVFEMQTRALMKRRSYSDLLPSIACPTLALVGDNDTVCPPSIHKEMIDHIADARLNIVPKCGHLSALEKPDLVSDSILNLVEATDCSSAKSNKCNVT